MELLNINEIRELLAKQREYIQKIVSKKSHSDKIYDSYIKEALCFHIRAQEKYKKILPMTSDAILHDLLTWELFEKAYNK